VYTQDFDPISNSLGVSSIFAVLPLVTLFVLLGGLKMKAQWAALLSLLVAMIVALAVYGLPFGQTALSATEGAAFGLFPIMWIVVAAIWVYNMTAPKATGAVFATSAIAAALIGLKPSAISITEVIATGVPRTAPAACSGR
jgi:L-lactate permease